jgi:hypothetical protein
MHYLIEKNGPWAILAVTVMSLALGCTAITAGFDAFFESMANDPNAQDEIGMMGNMLAPLTGGASVGLLGALPVIARQWVKRRNAEDTIREIDNSPPGTRAADQVQSAKAMKVINDLIGGHVAPATTKDKS